MKNKLIQISILLFLLFTTQAYSNPIDKINFIGLNNTSESSLLKLLPFKLGQNFSPYASDKIIEALFQTGFFSDIRISKNENSIDIVLKENPYIKLFDIQLDNKDSSFAWLKAEKLFITPDAIDEYLDSNELAAGNIYTKRKLDEFILFLTCF